MTSSIIIRFRPMLIISYELKRRSRTPSVCVVVAKHIRHPISAMSFVFSLPSIRRNIYTYSALEEHWAMQQSINSTKGTRG